MPTDSGNPDRALLSSVRPSHQMLPGGYPELPFHRAQPFVLEFNSRRNPACRYLPRPIQGSDLQTRLSFRHPHRVHIKTRAYCTTAPLNVFAFPGTAPRRNTSSWPCEPLC
jgi:hypothetical protein